MCNKAIKNTNCRHMECRCMVYITCKSANGDTPREKKMIMILSKRKCFWFHRWHFLPLILDFWIFVVIGHGLPAHCACAVIYIYIWMFYCIEMRNVSASCDKPDNVHMTFSILKWIYWTHVHIIFIIRSNPKKSSTHGARRKTNHDQKRDSGIQFDINNAPNDSWHRPHSFGVNVMLKVKSILWMGLGGAKSHASDRLQIILAILYIKLQTRRNVARKLKQETNIDGTDENGLWSWNSFFLSIRWPNLCYVFLYWNFHFRSTWTPVLFCGGMTFRRTTFVQYQVSYWINWHLYATRQMSSKSAITMFEILLWDRVFFFSWVDQSNFSWLPATHQTDTIEIESIFHIHITVHSCFCGYSEYTHCMRIAYTCVNIGVDSK